MPYHTFINTLQTLLGPTHVLTDDHDTLPLCLDWRGRYQGKPLAIAYPGTRQEVAEVIALCAAHQVAVVPMGGNTSTCGAATPDDSRQQLVIGLKRLNRLIAIDPDNNTMTVEAGMTLLEAQQLAARHQRLFPLSLASEGSCQIGGNLSTNAGGLAVLRYGTMRELALGIEVVLPDGQCLSALEGLRKNTTGLDLKQWFIGAEGQLGLITAATLKLFPLPSARATALVGVASPEIAIQWLGALKQRFGDRLTTYELMTQVCMELVARYQTADVPFMAPCTVLLELSDSGDNETLTDQLVEWLGERQDMLDGVIAMSESQRQSLWALREIMSETQRLQGHSIKHDIAVPSSAIPSFLTQAGARLEAAFPGCCIMAFGHAGDGNLHYNIAYTRPDNQQLFDDEHAVNQIVYDTVYALGGTLAAEHGIGQLKIHWLERYKDPLQLKLMRGLKQQLDPHNLMNPGKWLS